tara:strand:+ start:237 stop:497 length:261 start_codon:yes stop_codon:yes gene_type:complete
MSSKKNEPAVEKKRVMRTLLENPVEDFLASNKGVKYSVRSICKKLGVNRKYACLMLLNSPNIRKCDPQEVGSGRTRCNVFTWTDSE